MVRCLPSLISRVRIAWNGGHVVNMHDAALARGSRRNGWAVRVERNCPAHLVVCLVFRWEPTSSPPSAITRPRDGRSQPDRRRKADAAVSTSVSSTGCKSKVERLMTFSTSLVAVWYSSDSSRSLVRWRNSPSNRAFSIAITACAAKFSSRAICLSGNTPGFPALDPDEADHGSVLEQRHLQKRADTAQFDQASRTPGEFASSAIGHDVRGLDRLSGRNAPRDQGGVLGQRISLAVFDEGGGTPRNATLSNPLAIIRRERSRTPPRTAATPFPTPHRTPAPDRQARH